MALQSRTDNSTSLKYLPQLDALRGIACLMVLIAHLKGVTLLRWIPDVLGTAGVGVFFALSGFLITRLLLSDNRNNGSLLTFYNKRAARIFPIYYLTLVVLAVTWWGKELLWAANFTFNFRFLSGSKDYFSAINDKESLPPVAHFWSLCVEEHFYWIWPLMVRVIPGRITRWIPILLIALTPVATWYTASFLSDSGFSATEIQGLNSRITFLQLVALCVGATVAFHERRLSQPFFTMGRVTLGFNAVAGLVLASTTVIAHLLLSHFAPSASCAFFTTSLHLLCGAAFLLALSWPSLGKCRWLVSVGGISYGAYLFHLPVYAFLGLTRTNSAMSAWVGLLSLAITFTLAVISYRFLEKPIIHWVRSCAPSASRIRYAGALLTITIGAMFAVGFYSSYGTLAEMDFAEKGSPIQRDSSNTVVNHPSDTLPSSLEAIVVGSSHAEMGFAVPELQQTTYNMAFTSQDLWYDCAIATQLLDRLPHLKLVIFTISDFTFRHASCDKDGEKWRESLYFHSWNIPSRVKEADSKRYSRLVLANAGEDLAVLKAKAALRDEPKRGWRPKTLEHFSFESGKIAATRHSGNFPPARVEENTNILLTTIHKLQKAGVECVLVSTPKHQTYRANLPESQRQQTLDIIQLVCRRSGVCCYNYSEDSRFDEKYFFDGDHLNELGAVAFTRILNSDLRQRRCSALPPREKTLLSVISPRTSSLHLPGAQLRGE